MANNFEKMKDIAKEVNKLLQNTTEYEESTGNVIIKDDVIANLNKCVGLLKNILKIYKALPDFFDIPIPSVSKNDGLEIITKFAFVIEAANRIAKLPISKQNNEISRTFYSIKSSGIRKISRLSNISEITHKGSAIDLSKSIPTYSLQIGDKNQDKKKYAVVSWHLSTNLAGPDAYLINPSCKGWKAYSGEPITAYNPPDSGLRQFGMEDRYNEEGFRALMSMLADRRKSKIQQQISDWDKKLETQIRMNYSEDIDKKLATIRGYCQGKDIEEKRENVYLLNKILISLNFGNGMDFDKFMEEVGNKVDYVGATTYYNPILKLTNDAETEDDAEAITIYLKRDTNVETERISGNRTTEVTVDKIYGCALTNEAKVVIAKNLAVNQGV